MNREYLLETRQLSKDFRGFSEVVAVNLRVTKGSILP